jgi:4-amino-4-deoxy-L-arabinose transferase-like glycosyltransferase
LTTTPLITPQAAPPITAAPTARRWSIRSIAILLLAWFTLQIGGLFTPGLLDDVDSIYIEIAREMLHRHDYVTPYINGIRFFDKPPLMYWMAAGSMHLFGIHDWAARLPLALAVLALLIAVYALGIRLFASVSPADHPDRGGFYAALALATSIGPYLYTRFYIPDILLALWMTLAVHLFLIALDRIGSPQNRLPHLSDGSIVAKVGSSPTLWSEPLSSPQSQDRVPHVPLLGHRFSTTNKIPEEESDFDPALSTNHKIPGAPSFAASSRRVGVHNLPQPWVRSFALFAKGGIANSPLLPCLAFAAVMALNVLTKGLIGLVFPIAFVFLYLAVTKQLRLLTRLHPIASTAVFLIIAAPWHILAALRTPAIAMPAGLGLPARAGWAWFYLYNEHFARFLGKRIPHDYGLTPIWLFWLYLAIWITPWVTFFPAAIANHLRTLRNRLAQAQNRVPHLRRGFIAAKVGNFRGSENPLSSTEHDTPGAPSFAVSPRRVGEYDLDQPLSTQDTTRNHEAALSLLLWTVVVVGFFSISSRQEYYSLPALPALALMAAGLLTRADAYVHTARRSALHWHLYFLFPLTTLIATICGYFALTAPHAPRGTDISTLLAQNPEFYNLSLGHLFDLTGAAMGFFRGPLIAVALSMAGIGLGSYLLRRHGHTYAANLTLAAAMTVTLLAAHTGLARFYPILGSKSLALSINQASQSSPVANDLIVLDGELTSGSTLIFYTGQQVHLINGRVNGLWYGSFWPDAPAIFETESTLHQLWSSPRRIFLMTYTPTTRIKDLAPYGEVHTLAAAGGKTILTNH